MRINQNAYNLSLSSPRRKAAEFDLHRFSLAFAGKDVDVVADFANTEFNVISSPDLYRQLRFRRDQRRYERTVVADFFEHGAQNAPPESPVPAQSSILG
jgi:hypothetical protein